MSALRSKPTHPARQLLLSFGVSLLTLLLLGLGIYAARQANRRHLQMQTDERIGTVWVAGITYGPTHRLSCTKSPLSWLGLSRWPLPGNPAVVQGRYRGEPGSVEIWFAYRSALRQWPQLECHRVGQTAFVDDLGQSYHGFLDFQGSYVGVYLPGFDHAARHLTCTLQWMPRGQAPNSAISSRPMAFTIDLPPCQRLLPRLAASALNSVATTRKGVTVRVSAMRLAPEHEMTGDIARELIFRLSIHGGVLADTNVDSERAERLAMLSAHPLESGLDTLSNATLTLSNPPRPTRHSPSEPRFLPASETPSQHGKQLTIDDSYGYPLLPASSKIRPMLSLDTAHCIQDSNGTVWIAPVIGAGTGTDQVRLHLDVIPTTTGSPSVPIDLIVPLQSNMEL